MGIVTERDAVRAIAAGGTPLAQRPVREIMSSPVRSVVATTPLEDAIAELQSAGIRRLLVVDDAGSVMARLADEALYAAKAAGRNRWTIATARESATRPVAQSATT